MVFSSAIVAICAQHKIRNVFLNSIYCRSLTFFVLKPQWWDISSLSPMLVDSKVGVCKFVKLSSILMSSSQACVNDPHFYNNTKLCSV